MRRTSRIYWREKKATAAALPLAGNFGDAGFAGEELEAAFGFVNLDLVEHHHLVQDLQKVFAESPWALVISAKLELQPLPRDDGWPLQTSHSIGHPAIDIKSHWALA